VVKPQRLHGIGSGAVWLETVEWPQRLSQTASVPGNSSRRDYFCQVRKRLFSFRSLLGTVDPLVPTCESGVDRVRLSADARVVSMHGRPCLRDRVKTQSAERREEDLTNRYSIQSRERTGVPRPGVPSAPAALGWQRGSPAGVVVATGSYRSRLCIEWRPRLAIKSSPFLYSIEF
jgi:hypothetical protein